MDINLAKNELMALIEEIDNVVMLEWLYLFIKEGIAHWEV